MKYLFLTLFLLVLHHHASAEADGQTAVSLSDQFGTETLWPPADKRPLVLIYSDRDGSRHAGPWIEAVRTHEDCLTLVEAANLEAAPRVARPFVRRAFRNSSPVLMDWRGRLAALYGFDEGKTNAYLFDEQGDLIHQASGSADKSSLKDFTARLEAHCLVSGNGDGQ